MTLKFQPLNFPNHDTLGCPSFAVNYQQIRNCCTSLVPAIPIAKILHNGMNWEVLIKVWLYKSIESSNYLYLMNPLSLIGFEFDCQSKKENTYEGS